MKSSPFFRDNIYWNYKDIIPGGTLLILPSSEIIFNALFLKNMNVYSNTEVCDLKKENIEGKLDQELHYRFSRLSSLLSTSLPFQLRKTE